MKFLLTRTSDLFSSTRNETIEINSIEELIELVRKEGEIIVGPVPQYRRTEELPYEIEIYDSYRE